VFFDYPLPFTFPFYGEDQTEIRVCLDGWLNFGPHVGSTYNNSEVALAANKRIAVLWDDLRTDQGGDIYIDESVAGQITFRWDAVTRSGSHPCNFSAMLFSDGKIRFDYGSGNNPLTATVGVSAGDTVHYFLSSYDSVPDLGDADSLLIDFSHLPAGLEMDGQGVVSGTPTETGSFKPIFRIEDQSERTDEKMIPLLVVEELFGDYNLDGVVDLSDFEAFFGCLADPSPTQQCLDVFDDNGNALVDLWDFTLFQRSYS
jgi:hypothetical protein